MFEHLWSGDTAVLVYVSYDYNGNIIFFCGIYKRARGGFYLSNAARRRVQVIIIYSLYRIYEHYVGGVSFDLGYDLVDLGFGKYEQIVGLYA